MTTSELMTILEKCPDDTEIIIEYETYARRSIGTVNFNATKLIIAAENI